jgi:acetyl esterase/lipase
MKKISLLTLALCLVSVSLIQAQQGNNPVKKQFSAGTIFHENIAYANDTLKKHLLDIYLPAQAKPNLPLVVWIHGGAWMKNDKYADMGYMKNTINELLAHGFAIASIDYRQSTDAIFPAQIQDCNAAIVFLSKNAKKYGLDNHRFALMGFSAGGHLASLLALSLNNDVKSFQAPNTTEKFSIKAVVDFYGPANLMLMPHPAEKDLALDPLTLLLGATYLERPDLVKQASPVTYIDKNDPPFLIINGEKDESVPKEQSILLSAQLRTVGIDNELIIVKGAPHYGVMFDTEEIRTKILNFLKTKL